MDINPIRKLEGFTNPKQIPHTYWVAPLTALIVVFGWELTVRLMHLPTIILPSPIQVLERFGELLVSGSLMKSTSATFIEIVLGLLAGSITATLLGYFIAKSHLFERLVSPFLVASQAVPVVAIAPLLFIWFDTGMFTKVLICALIVFFPVLINTVVGIRAVPQSLHELMRSLRATRWQILRHLEIPAACRFFSAGCALELRYQSSALWLENPSAWTAAWG